MPGAFFRLLLRPINLFMLFVLFWAVLGPGLVIGSDLGDRVIADFRAGAPTTALLHYALILGITLPAAFGFIAAMASLELQYTRMSWMLPDLARRLTVGIVAFMIPAAALVGWLTARASGPALGVAAFAIALFWFAAMLHVPDAAVRSTARWLVLAAFIAGMLRPDLYVAIVSAQPAMVAISASILAVLLVRQHTTSHLRRRRMAVASSFQSGTTRSTLFWQHAGGTERTWTRSMVDASPTAWAGAALHEMIGTVKHGWGVVLGGYALIGAIAYVMSPGMLLIMCFNIAFGGIQLRTRLLYPLSRGQRALVLYIGNFLDVLLLVTASGASAGLLAVLNMPRIHNAANSAPFEMLMALLLMFAVVPIAQWARVRGPLAADAAKQMGRHVAFPIAAWAATVFAMNALIDNSKSIPPAEQLWIVFALIVTAQTLHFLGIRWYYGTRDLA